MLGNRQSAVARLRCLATVHCLLPFKFGRHPLLAKMLLAEILFGCFARHVILRRRRLFASLLLLLLLLLLLYTSKDNDEDSALWVEMEENERL